MEFNIVYNLMQDVDAALHSGGVSQLKNFYQTMERGRLRFISKVRPEELVRKAYLEDALFPDVFRYAAPSDLKYQDVIWLKKLDNYRSVDTLDHPTNLVYDRRFSQKRNGAGNVLSIGYENGIKYAKVQSPRGLQQRCHQLIHNCDSLNDNGTWNVGGNVVNFKLDELNHVQGRASYSFDINNSASTGLIANYSLTAFDLHEYLQKGATFSWLSLPIPKEMTSVKLVMGSDVSNITTDYYYATVNQPHDNNTFTSGWNLLKWMLNVLVPVGTPNPRALSWVEIHFTTTGNPIPNCHIDNIVARRGDVYELKYNSTYMLRDPLTGAFKKRATSNDDIIVAEEDSYLIYMLEVTLDAQKEIYGNGTGAKSDVTEIENELNGVRTTRGILIKPGLYDKYKMEHKSQALLDSDEVHVFGNMYDGYSDDLMPGFGNEFNQGGLNNGGGNGDLNGGGDQHGGDANQ